MAAVRAAQQRPDQGGGKPARPWAGEVVEPSSSIIIVGACGSSFMNWKRNAARRRMRNDPIPARHCTGGKLKASTFRSAAPGYN